MWRLLGSLALALVVSVAGPLPVTGHAAPTAAPAAAPTAAPNGRAEDVRNGCLRSVPEPGTTERVKICWTLFKPAGADRRHRVPLMMHSHGWGGTRTRDVEAFRDWLDAGYGVLSFDQRGFGESGGYAHVERPEFEGRDNLRLIRMVSRLRWVQQDGPGDPRLGAMGGSYGGGFQYLGAFLELQKRGKPVYDALAPEITWNDLSESLGPQGVPRVQWASILGTGALPSDALEPEIKAALAEGATTGRWPDGTGPSGVDLYDYFRKNGPAWHVSQGRRLDIPVLMGQGTTDTLFNLEQGFSNFQQALTRRARRDSIFVGYNGGHALPAVTPPGLNPSGDPCSRRLGGGDFGALTLQFMDEHLKGERRRLDGYGDYHLATPTDTCRTVSSVRPGATYDVGTVVTPSGAPAWLATPIVEGPVRLAGSAHLVGDLTTLGGTNRAFYGLAIGTNPLDAKLVQNNVYPLSVEGAVTGERRRLELPAVAVDVPRGQTLYVVASGVSDTFLGAGGRTPGVVTLDDTVAHLPVVGR